MVSPSTPSDPVVRLSTGTVRGTALDGVDRYLGVPYAAAPVGDLRFALPEPHPGWSEVRDAGAFGATAPQADYAGAIGELLPTVRVPGDELLNVNVWAPRGGTGLPVMVWVHGGSLSHGSNPLGLYDGSAFARDGVVFVALNYRLGTEGFSVLEGAPLNLGLADVVAALRWVQREIAAFGGDPARVTVFGESAGAILLGVLLPHPDAGSLFARMILESGLPASAPPDKAGRITRDTAKHLGIPATQPAFAAVAPDALVEAQSAATAGSTPITGGVAFTLAEGDDLLPRSPGAALFAGEGSRIPLLVGSNTEEYRLWFVPTGLMSRIGAGLFAAARVRFGIGRGVLAAYRARHPEASRGELFGALATDILLRLPINRIADARLAKGSPTWVYEFAWRSPVQDLGAAHAMELGFVFDGLGTDDARRLGGPGAPQQLADEMHGAWVRFATTGDPGWRAWDARRPVQTFDSPASGIVEAPREEERASWRGRR